MFRSEFTRYTIRPNVLCLKCVLELEFRILMSIINRYVLGETKKLHVKKERME
uniref:Uncharacterized protein n=1 Tax=Anguilla anguilla TaxID=7936 RepID=A0A0E9PZ82_ANGAN